MTEMTCHYDPDLGWLTREHVRDCKAHDCPGCKPCGRSHCGMRDRCGNHVAQHAGIFTCPSCIGKTRRGVKKILERYAELAEEYEFVGVDSEALNLHGPAAYPGQWSERRRRLVEQYESRGWCEYPKHTAMAEDDPHHPLAVLGRWDMAIRESFEQPTDLFVTVSRAVDYLAGDILDTFAQHQEFEDFSRDVAACLSHLEDVLALSVRPELGAPCPTCRVDLQGQVDEQGKQRKAPRLHKRYGRDKTGLDDTWHCPVKAEHWWIHRDYRAMVDEDFLQHADRLTAQQMHAAHGITPGTVRQWATRGVVKRRGLNSFGQMLYDVEEAKTARDGHAEARRA